MSEQFSLFASAHHASGISFTTPEGNVTFKLDGFNYFVEAKGNQIVIDPQRIKEETLFSAGIAAAKAAKQFFAPESRNSLNAQRLADQLAAQAALGFDPKQLVIETVNPAQANKGELGNLSVPTMTAAATMDRSNQRST